MAAKFPLNSGILTGTLDLNNQGATNGFNFYNSQIARYTAGSTAYVGSTGYSNTLHYFSGVTGSTSGINIVSGASAASSAQTFDFISRSGVINVVGGTGVSIINSTSKQITSNTLGRATHLGSDTWVLTSVASTGSAGFMSASDKSKLDAVPTGGSQNTPKIVYVDGVNGNDSTAAIGFTSKPYATFAAGYAAGRALATSFAMHFAAGDYEYDPDDLEESFLYCGVIRGAGKTLTNITINAARADVQNAGGTPGYVIPSLQIDDLTFRATTSGGGVEESDNNSYTCGNGGAITIFGTALVAEITASGGGEVMSTGSTISGGNGGVITMSGGLDCRSCGFSLSGGSGSAVAGNVGEIVADNCDLRLVTSISPTTTLGRCSYDSGSFTVTNDIGGNASY